VAQLYPQALGSLHVASYDSQGMRRRYSNPPLHGEVSSCSSSNYVATDGQSASSSWCRAPFGAGDQILNLSTVYIGNNGMNFIITFVIVNKKKLLPYIERNVHVLSISILGSEPAL
jgi:hypothetical protein